MWGSSRFITAGAAPDTLEIVLRTERSGWKGRGAVGGGMSTGLFT